jgi:hypothetical protein
MPISPLTPQRTHSSPTCYTFPAPPSYAHSAQVPVLAALYPGAAEAGMILVGPSGEVRFWDNVGIALANVDRYIALDLELAEDDFAERLFRVDVSGRVRVDAYALRASLELKLTQGIKLYHHHDLRPGLPTDHHCASGTCCAQPDPVDTARGDVWPGQPDHLPSERTGRGRHCRRLVRRSDVSPLGQDHAKVAVDAGSPQGRCDTPSPR